MTIWLILYANSKMLWWESMLNSKLVQSSADTWHNVKNNVKQNVQVAWSYPCPCKRKDEIFYHHHCSTCEGGMR